MRARSRAFKPHAASNAGRNPSPGGERYVNEIDAGLRQHDTGSLNLGTVSFPQKRESPFAAGRLNAFAGMTRKLPRSGLNVD